MTSYPDHEGKEPPPDRTVIADQPSADIPDHTVIGPETAPSDTPAAPADPTLIGDQPQTQGGAAVRLVQPGTLINNNYRINSLVSVGGMGEVYRAENVFTGDPVAVKVILPDLAQDAAVLDLFRREARVLVQLRDDAIVRYHNFVLDNGLGRYCLIMEFVEGRHLGARVNEDGPLDDHAALALMRRLAAGLGRAHASGVTHRDLSPDNVILRDERVDEAVLIDFGIARSTELGDGLAGRFAGKFKYIAPEQLGHWGGDIGPWTDVYGLALLIAMVARGKPLAMGDSVISASTARQAIPDLGGLSHRLFPLLQHMLEPDPQRRPRDMAQVLRMIEDPLHLPAQYRLPLWSASTPTPEDSEAGPTVIAADPVTLSDSPFAAQPMPAKPVSDPPRPSGRGRWIAGGAVVAVLAIATGAFLALRPDQPEPVAEVPDPPPVAALAERDETTREGFLASQSLPDCTLAYRIERGANAGMIATVGAGPVDGSALLAAYEAQFGTRPSLVSQQVAQAQCPAVDFLRQISGRPAAAPALSVDVQGGGQAFQIRGEVSGMAARNLWLFLVAPDGAVYDLTAQATRDADGRDRFGISVGMAEGGQPYLLAALASDVALTSVAAAPAASPAAELLPRVLDELRAAGAAPAADLVVITPEPAEEPAEPEAEEPEAADPAD